MTEPAREIHEPEMAGIPLNPRKKDYRHLKFWNKAPWQLIRNGSEIKDIESPILTLFFEDETGALVSDEIKKQVRLDLAGYWFSMLEEGETPRGHDSHGLKRQEDYRETMEDKYPWLRLCDGHWKVKQIWTNYYRKQRIDALALGKRSKHTTPFMIFDAEADTVPRNLRSDTFISDERTDYVGSKRGRGGEDDLGSGQSKKPKGDVREVFDTTNFNHSRSQPVWRVRKRSFLFVKNLLKFPRLIYCTHSFVVATA